MGTVIRICNVNACRFASDLAIGTVMRICDENAGRFANGLAVGTGYEFVTRNAGRFVNDLARGTIIEFGMSSDVGIKSGPKIMQKLGALVMWTIFKMARNLARVLTNTIILGSRRKFWGGGGSGGWMQVRKNSTASSRSVKYAVQKSAQLDFRLQS